VVVVIHPAGTIMLMTARTGAVGLTLTEANYVFFLDPFLNREMENQASYAFGIAFFFLLDFRFIDVLVNFILWRI
jgi:hypothetical protein